MDANKTILLIEDNPSDVLLTKRALKKAGIANSIVVADDGEVALDYLFGAGAYAGRDISELPILTLLDLNLPKVAGLDVLRRVRQDARTKRLPVIILTTSGEPRDVGASYDLGANSYVTKPVDFNQFAHAVEQLGLYWLLLNEPPPRD